MAQYWTDECMELERSIHLAPVRDRGRCVVLYPNTYQIGMSNLSVHVLYDLFNSAGIACERAFVPHDGEYEDVRSMEMRTPLAGFEYILLTCSYELDWLNVPRLLEGGGIPPLRDDRTGDHPVIIAGGPAVSSNPQPLADIIDVGWVGEVEPMADELIDACAAATGRGEFLDRMEALAATASADGTRGLYLPARYPTGSNSAVAHPTVKRLYAKEIEAFSTETAILTPRTTFPDRFLIEIGRGCPHNCRFCLARQLYEPMRTRSAKMLMRRIENALEYTDRVGLVAAAVSDHPEIDRLADDLARRGVSVSVSSVRADRVTEPLLAAMGRSGQTTLTLAPETGTERLRRRVGKPMTDADIHRAVETALKHGISRYKMYFLVGLPDETQRDVDAIAQLMRALKTSLREATFTVSISPFIPKPHTQFADGPQLPRKELNDRIKAVRDGLRKSQIDDVTVASVRWAEVETVLSHGGSELGEAIVEASLAGAGFGDIRSAVGEYGKPWDEYLPSGDSSAGGGPADIVAFTDDCDADA